MHFDTVDSFFNQSESLFEKHKDCLDIFDAFGDLAQILETKQKPHQCPQCGLRFKYDIALLRHERKAGHSNPEREIRQKNRYLGSSPKEYQCHCSQKFAKSIELLNHKKVCGKPPKAQQAKQKQSESKDSEQALICDQNQAPCYFPIVQQNRSDKRQSQRKQVRRIHLSQQSKAKLAKEFKKYKKLNSQAIERFSRNLGISQGAIRKYFYGQKRRAKQANSEIE